MRKASSYSDEEEQMQAAMAKGNLFFYAKPVILRRWKEGDELGETITHVPIWVQLPNLPLEMWGPSSLSKITSKIGEPLHSDEMTAKKLKLEYARVLVKVEIGKDLPKEINIKSLSSGKEIKQLVKYEWIPMYCHQCRIWGHLEKNCTKPVQKVWKVKQKADSEEAAQEHRGLESPAPEIKDKGQSVDEVQESTPPVEPKHNTNE